MNEKEFIIGIGVYYKQPLKVQSPQGEIHNPQLTVMNKWLRNKKLTEERINTFYAKVIREFVPTSTVTLPPIKYLDEWLFGPKELRAERAWELLKTLSSTLSYIFEDKKIQQVIETMSGNIKDFVLWKDDIIKSVWCKKEFIKLYLYECEYERDIKRKPLLGSIDIHNRKIGSCVFMEDGKPVKGIMYKGSPENKELIITEFKQEKIEFCEKEIPKEVISNIGKMIHRN